MIDVLTLICLLQILFSQELLFLHYFQFRRKVNIVNYAVLKITENPAFLQLTKTLIKLNLP